MLLTYLLLALAADFAPPASPVTTFSGHLAHAPAGEVVRLDVGVRHLQAPLSPGGDFEVKLTDLTAPTPVHFAYAGQHTRLQLAPGDQLRLALDFRDFDRTLTYSGRGADRNNYLAQAQYKFEYGPAGSVPRPQDQASATTTPAQMRQYCDAFRRSRLAYLAAYAQAHPLPAAFVHEQQFAIQLDWATRLLAYPVLYRSTHAEAPVPAEYFGFLPQFPWPELGQHWGRGIDENTAVIGLLDGYVNYLVPTDQLSTDPAEGPRLYEVATRELGDGKMRDFAMRLLMTTRLDASLAGAQVFYRTFRLHNADSTLAQDVRLMLTKKALLAPGQLAPGFQLTANTGQQVALSDFRGKVVYLDFWGTWCGPCLRELTEFSSGLKKQFEGRDVVFLYVSMGDPEAKWQQTIIAKQLAGPNSVHLREAPNSPRQVATDYQVNSFPTYMLIGRDGRILRAPAPRPSEGAKTVAAIEQALSQ